MKSFAYASIQELFFYTLVLLQLLADLDRLIPSLDQNPAHLANTDALVADLDIHNLASFLQIQKVIY